MDLDILFPIIVHLRLPKIDFKILIFFKTFEDNFSCLKKLT